MWLRAHFYTCVALALRSCASPELLQMCYRCICSNKSGVGLAQAAVPASTWAPLCLSAAPTVHWSSAGGTWSTQDLAGGMPEACRGRNGAVQWAAAGVVMGNIREEQWYFSAHGK